MSLKNQELFQSVLTNENKHQTILQNYFVIQDENFDQFVEESKYYAFQEPIFDIPEPKVSIWNFLSKDDLTDYLKLHHTVEMKTFLESMTMDKYFPKGTARSLFIELMCSVTKFCKKCSYNLEKTGALLSQFYLTHILTTSAFDRTTEKVYTYFKELALAHTLPDFPPKSAKIFSQDETKKNMEFFCQLYLRNLSLIRFLCLPNFALLFQYEVEKQEKKDKKDKKEKKNKKEPKKSKK